MTDTQLMEDELDPTEVKAKLGTLMDIARESKQRIQALTSELSQLKQSHQDTLDQILATMRTLGINSTKKDGVASVSITPRQDAAVKDWDKFYEWIAENNMPQILQKRVMSAGYRELREQGIEIPGVEDYEHDVLNVKVL